jgi:predicted acylesterase/phospholipase RssA
MNVVAPQPRGKEIGLALSGGGVRAAVFHLGVLKRLADEGLLESVSAISTVSGGSLVMAAIVSRADAVVDVICEADLPFSPRLADGRRSIQLWCHWLGRFDAIEHSAFA